MEAKYPYKIVRTQNAGVFAGYLITKEKRDVVLIVARRLWRWSGAASLSQLSVDGVKHPEDCKFPAPVLRVHLFEVIEILDVTPEAQKSIEEVTIWQSE